MHFLVEVRRFRPSRSVLLSHYRVYSHLYYLSLDCLPFGLLPDDLGILPEPLGEVNGCCSEMPVPGIGTDTVDFAKSGRIVNVRPNMLQVRLVTPVLPTLACTPSASLTRFRNFTRTASVRPAGTRIGRATGIPGAGTGAAARIPGAVTGAAGAAAGIPIATARRR